MRHDAFQMCHRSAVGLTLAGLKSRRFQSVRLGSRRDRQQYRRSVVSAKRHSSYAIPCPVVSFNGPGLEYIRVFTNEVDCHFDLCLK
jgi:hypothetical protein